MDFNKEELILIMNSLLFISDGIDRYIDDCKSDFLSFSEAIGVQGDLFCLIFKVQNKIKEK